MKKLVGVAALAGLTACASPESMYYEVSQRSVDSVVIQANKGNIKPDDPIIAGMKSHMDNMAANECQKMKKTGAAFQSERQFRGGPYYSWLERTYSCV